MSHLSAPYSPRPVSRALLAAGLWLRVGLASLMLAGGVLAGLVHGSIGPLPALVAIAGSVAVAVWSWRRSAAVLDRADADEARSTLAPARA